MWSATPLIPILLFHIFVRTVFATANSTSRTFTEHGESFVSFHPTLRTAQNQTWSISFRTDRANALLLYHSLDRYNRRDFPSVHDYGMYIEVKQARLAVTYLVNEHKDEFIHADFLNEDTWHTIELSIIPLAKELRVTVDKEMRRHKLKAYLWGNAAKILDWSNLPSTVSYGGTERAIPFGYDTFIGCMRDVGYLSASGSYSEITVERSAHVQPGCNDLCASHNPCVSRGRCINHYSSSDCDCYATGHDGPQCQIPGGITMTLHGYEWLIHKLYVDADDKVNSRLNHFSLEFKTQRSVGVLIYSVGSTPHHSHVVATLYGGTVHISLSFGGEDIEMRLGIGQDDNRWHSLSIDHDKRLVNVTLDNVTRRRYIKGRVTYLNLDPDIHIGGGDSFVVTRVWRARPTPGLKVTQNFAGCLRNVFINSISVLFTQKIGNQQRTKFYGSSPTYRCEPLGNVPLSFPRSASMLLIDAPSSQQVTVTLQFRTFSSDGILMYMELRSAAGVRGYETGGFVELWLSDGDMLVHFIPNLRAPEYSQDLMIPLIINDGVWHTLVFVLYKRQVTLTVDELTVRSLTYVDDLYLRGSIAIGYGLRRYKTGFIGCMRQINVQGRDVDPIDVVHTQSAVGLVLDGCPLVNRCGSVSVCEHGSICVSDWYGTQCDCSKVPYEGKTCHFAIFRRSCDEIYQSGWHRSGVYQIDPDGNGPLPASYVRCRMGYRRGDEIYGVTEIDHNLRPNTTVRDVGLPHIRMMISYRFMDRWKLRALTKHSLQCAQHISFQCYQAPLRLGEKTLFVGVNGEPVNHIGTIDPGYCSCFMDRSCMRGEACNCDSGERRWLSDAGNNTSKHQLPITEMVFMQEGHGRGRVTLGSLQCWGSEYMTRHGPVTFKSPSAYIVAPAWTTGDLLLSFRTTLSSAVILHQTSQDDENHFMITIVSANEVAFTFGGDRPAPLRYVVSSESAVNSGEWVLLRVEHDAYNVRLTVNTRTKMYELGEARVGAYDGDMYIGTAQPAKAEATVGGFMGCIRGVMYNDVNVDLTRFINDRNAAMVAEGCPASCQSHPCKNGGRCIEKWNGYICQCRNPWSHLGHDCEKNLDEDVISLNGSDHSYVIFKEKKHLSLLEERILLSIRTWQVNTQLFYGHDHLNNFIQLEVRGGQELVVRFNTYGTIIEESLRVPRLSDGAWKQIVVERGYDGSVTLRCGSLHKTVQARRVPLTQYSMQPFLYVESIKPARPERMRNEFVYIYLGGVEKSMKTARTYANFLGCLRGVRIGQITLHLQPAAYSYRGVTDGCVPGCTPSVCNKGTCKEMWAGTYTCDCTRSYYTGPQCTVDPSVLFNGRTIVQADIDLLADPDLQHTLTERITFHFKTNIRNSQKAILVVVYSLRTRDYIIVSLSPEGTVVVETNLFSAVYIVKNVGNYTDGLSHFVEYQRRKSNLSLTMDYSRIARMIYPEYELDNVDTIMVGGFHLYDPRLKGYTNFSGCITDVTFYPGATSDIMFKPLTGLHYRPRDPGVTVLGGPETTCHAATSVKPSYITRPVSTTPSTLNLATMPQWNMKPANTVVIGHPNTTTTTTANPNDTIIYPVLRKHDSDDVTIILAVALVSFFMVVAIIITIFIMCLRRRDDEKKKLEQEQQEYFELKKPLKVQDEKLTVHLASLDEFSLSSDERPPVSGFQSCTYRFVEPITEDSSWLNPPINHRKHRPASSISEVLEEMERRRKAKERGVERSDLYDDPNSDKCRSQSASQYGLNLEWDHSDLKPSSCNNLGEALTTTDVCVHSEPHFNGDSGYEADSKPTDSEHINTSKSPTELKQLLTHNTSSFDSDVSSDASLISETDHDLIHSVDSVSDLSVLDEIRRPSDDFDDRIVIIEATPPESNVTTPSSVKELPYCVKNSADNKDSPSHHGSPRHGQSNDT